MATATTEIVQGGSFLLTPIGQLPQFTPEDLSDDSKEFGRAARDFIEGEVLPRDAQIDQLDLPLTIELLRKAGEIGLLSIEIPEAYEGLELDKKSSLLVLEEMSKQGSFSVSYGACTGIGRRGQRIARGQRGPEKELPAKACGWTIAVRLCADRGWQRL